MQLCYALMSILLNILAACSMYMQDWFSAGLCWSVSCVYLLLAHEKEVTRWLTRIS